MPLTVHELRAEPAAKILAIGAVFGSVWRSDQEAVLKRCLRHVTDAVFATTVWLGWRREEMVQNSFPFTQFHGRLGRFSQQALVVGWVSDE